MGKKSKKGVSRAGKTQRPKAGKGKVARSKSVTSANSIASSKEDLPYDVQASSEMKASAAELPRNVVISPETTAETLSTDGDFDKENTTALGSDAAGESLLGTDVHTEENGEPEIIPEPTEPPKAEESNTIWSTNIREAITNDIADEPAVLDVTMDQSIDQSVSETPEVLEPIIESPVKGDSSYGIEANPKMEEPIVSTPDTTPTIVTEPVSQQPAEPTLKVEDAVVDVQESNASESTPVVKATDAPVEGKVTLQPDAAPQEKQSVLSPPESALDAKATGQPPAFDKPASAEANAKQKDCQCVIL